jgi:hypothetical protein
VLLRRSGSQDKLESDERDDEPLLGSGSEEFEESELVGKGTKIDDLIARVCTHALLPHCRNSTLNKSIDGPSNG